MTRKKEHQGVLRQELQKDLVGYFSETTVHGFRYIVEGRNRCERISWLLFIAFGFWYAGVTIYNAYQYWETHPVETRYYPDDEPYRLDASNFLIPTPQYLNDDLERNGFQIVETFRTKDVCCGRRYAVRAVKVSDNPQPENTYLGAKTTSDETFTFSPRKSFQWGV